jgi:hypothetical protein
MTATRTFRLLKTLRGVWFSSAHFMSPMFWTPDIGIAQRRLLLCPPYVTVVHQHYTSKLERAVAFAKSLRSRSSSIERDSAALVQERSEPCKRLSASPMSPISQAAHVFRGRALGR